MFQVRAIYSDGEEEIQRFATREIAFDRAEENVYLFMCAMNECNPLQKLYFTREQDDFDVERFRIMEGDAEIMTYEVSDGRNAFTVYH